MLTKIQTKNYRNLDLEDGVTLGALNIFVGPNGSGKSNLIRVLKFIQDGLIGAPDPKRGITSFESAIADFGSGRVLDGSIKSPAIVHIGLAVKVSTAIELYLDLDLEVRTSNLVTIQNESFYKNSDSDQSKRDYFYQCIQPGSQNGKLWFRLTTNRAVTVSETSEYSTSFFFQSAPSKVTTVPEKVDHNLTKLTKGRNLLTEELVEWSFYDSSQMNIEILRHPKQEIGVTDQTLSPLADNLVPVLSNLFRDHIDFEERILDAMRELFPQTRRLRVVPEGRTLAIQWFVNGIDEPFYIDQMSTGTIRMLCWATVLLSPKKHKLIVIEEPENDLHPAWLRILAGWIRQASRESQVIVSTHSPDLLDFFTDDLESVRVFAPSPKDPAHNVVTTLDPQKVKPKLEEGWQLGDLYRVGDPSIGGWPW